MLRKLLLFFIFLSFINASPASGGWFGENIPVPQATEEVKKNERLMHGSKMEFSYYASSLSAEEIKDFYRKELPIRGWKERNILKTAEASENLPKRAVTGLQDFSETNLVFDKDKQMLVLTIVPAAMSRGANTRYSIAYGEVDMAKIAEEEANPAPALLTKPQKDIAPVYPGASLIYLAENEKTLRATYSVPDEIKNVVSFYKDKMLNYGWSLVAEKPAQKLDMGSPVNMDKLYPGIEKTWFPSSVYIDMYSAQLDFSNEARDICKVGFTYTDLKKFSGEREIPSLTTVVVNYEKAK